MSELRPEQILLRAIFDDRWPDDEDPEIETWQCAKCKRDFIDPDDFPHAYNVNRFRGQVLIEPTLYWLGVTEPVCSSCAAKSGLPPVDKE